jgi:hypothetical protein
MSTEGLRGSGAWFVPEEVTLDVLEEPDQELRLVRSDMVEGHRDGVEGKGQQDHHQALTLAGQTELNDTPVLGIGRTLDVALVLESIDHPGQRCAVAEGTIGELTMGDFTGSKDLEEHGPLLDGQVEAGRAHATFHRLLQQESHAIDAVTHGDGKGQSGSVVSEI